MRKSFICFLLCLSAFAADGQALKTGYFQENWRGAMTLNPAFAPDQGYATIPILGNLVISADSNIGLDAIAQRKGGEYVLFTDPSIPESEVMSRFRDYNNAGAVVGTSIIDFGRYVGRSGFFSLNISLEADAQASVPAAAVQSLKTIGDRQNDPYADWSGIYNFNRVSAGAQTGLTAALGYSFEILPGLRVGGRINGYADWMDMSLNADNLTVAVDGNKADVSGKADMVVHLRGGKIDDDNNIKFDAKKIGPIGWGLSADLGMSYTLDSPELPDFLRGLQVSAAVSGIGSRGASDKSALYLLYDGNMHLDYEETDFDYNDLIDKIKDVADYGYGDLDKAAKTPKARMASSYNLGVKIPLMTNAMSAGILYTGYRGKVYNLNELTISYNLHPVRWFGLSVGYEALCAKTMGFLLNLTPSAVANFFVGVDGIPTRWSKGFLPGGPFSTTAQMGLSVPIGKVKRQW